MKKYTKIYLDYFNYCIDDFIACEVCDSLAVDIHHIDCKGMGGSKTKDEINNLMALCRKCHIEYGDKKNHLEFLKSKHEYKISSN